MHTHFCALSDVALGQPILFEWAFNMQKKDASIIFSKTVHQRIWCIVVCYNTGALFTVYVSWDAIQNNDCLW